MTSTDSSLSVQTGRIRRDLEAINAFNATPDQGVTRLTFSLEHQGAVAYVAQELERIGAAVSFVRGGNLRGRLAGSIGDGPAVMTGSHLDTVIHGGGYDGKVGVVAALEVGRIIAERNIPHRFPIDLVVFAEEEGARFSQGVLGSSIWTGRVPLDGLSQIIDKDGISYLEAMDRARVRIDDQELLNSQGLRAMLEIHIEQSTVLESKGLSIGVVEAIVGLKHYEVTIKGEADHAGATPMVFRYDALQGAAQIISAVEEIALAHSPKTVATVGRVSTDLGQINVIPGRAKFSLDIRDIDATTLDTAVAKITRTIEDICQARKLHYDIKLLLEVAPVTMSTEIIDLIERKADTKNVETLRMYSGAGHDASNLAKVTRTGMIFVPSRKGRSHCPEEFTDAEDIALAAEILLLTVMELAA